MHIKQHLEALFVSVGRYSDSAYQPMGQDTLQPHRLQRFFKNHLHLYGANGRLIGTSAQHHHATSDSIAGQQYFKQTMQQAKPLISDPTSHGHTENQANIVFTAPVIRGNGQVVAVLTGSFNLYEKNPLSRYVSITLGKSGNLRII